MDDQVTPVLAQSSAVHAFEELRGEVSLLRRAVEGLAAERRDQPDYGPTLEALVTSNEEIREWARRVGTIAENSIVAYRSHGYYPTADSDYWTLVNHPGEQTDAYRVEATKGSTLYPLLALWSGSLGDAETFVRLADFKRDDVPHCTFQFWLPDQESEAAIWRYTEEHGAALCGLNLDEGAAALFDLVFEESRTNRHFAKLSAVRLDHWPVLLVACRHYRLPVPPHFWASLLTCPSPSEGEPTTS